MNYKCVNDLDKFSFRDADVLELQFSPDVFLLELSGGIAKYNNPCNTQYVDSFIGEIQIRLMNPVITRFFLEGQKYYNADDVLIREVLDSDIPPESYDETLEKLKPGIVFLFREQEPGVDGRRHGELSIDVEEDTYWIELEYEKIILEWDRFKGPVEE